MKKITEEQYNVIKKAIDTPVLVKPSLRMVAESLGYSIGTVLLAANTNGFEEYSKARNRKPIESDWFYYDSIRVKNKKAYDDFNNEWFFEDK